MRIAFHEVEQIRGRWFFVWNCLRRCAGKNEVIEMTVFEKIEKRANVGMPFDYHSILPIIIISWATLDLVGQMIFGAWARWIPSATWWKHIRFVGYSRHDIDLYRDGPQLWVLLPAVSQYTVLDNLFNDHGGLYKCVR